MSKARKNKTVRAVREGNVEVRKLDDGRYRIVAFGAAAGSVTLKTKHELYETLAAIEGYVLHSIKVDESSAEGEA